MQCRFGGTRAYFVCPELGNGVQCGRRVAKIYGPKPYFRCRYCYQLPYASQYERGLERANRRVNKIRQRFSGYVGVAASLPEKPRGMWLRSYERLLEQTLEAEMRLEEARTNQARRLLAQLENIK